MLNSQQVYAVKLNETVWPSPMSHWTDELKIPFVLKLPRFITSQRDHTVKAIAAVITYWWRAVIRGQICTTPYQKGNNTRTTKTQVSAFLSRNLARAFDSTGCALTRKPSSGPSSVDRMDVQIDL